MHWAKRNIILFTCLLLCAHVKAQQPQLVLPVGHTSAVLSAEYSPDGKYIVTTSKGYIYSSDNTAVIWESLTGRLLHKLKSEEPITNVNFSPNGEQLFTTSVGTGNKSEIILWDIKTGTLLWEIAVPMIRWIDYSSNGRYFVTCSEGTSSVDKNKGWESIDVREAETGKLLRTLKSDTSFYQSGERYFGARSIFSPDSKYILTTDRNKIILWNTVDGSVYHDLESVSSFIYNIRFSPNGKYIALISLNDSLKIIESSSGKVLQSLTAEGSWWGTDITYSPDSKFLLESTYDENIVDSSKIILYEISTGKLLYTIKGYLANLPALSLSHNGKHLITASGPSSLDFKSSKMREFSPYLWEFSTGKLIKKLSGNLSGINSITFSPDDKYVLASSEDNSVCQWEVSSGKLVNKLEGYTEGVSSLSFSPDGKYILHSSGSLFNQKNGSAFLWNVNTGKLIYNFRCDSFKFYNAYFSKTGKQIISTGGETISIWYAETGVLKHKETGTIKTNYNLDRWELIYQDVQFSADRKYMIARYDDSVLGIWNVETGNLLSKIKYPNDGYGKTYFINSQGTIVITFTPIDSKISVYESFTGRLLYEIKGTLNPLLRSPFSPDGKYLKCYETSNFYPYTLYSSICLWDVSKAKLAYKLEGHSGPIKNAVFSPDGKLFVTVSDDKTAIIWDVETGKLLHKLIGHADGVMDAKFSAEGEYLLTASYDGSVIIWKTATGELLSTIHANYQYLDKIDISSDGNHVVIASLDGIITLWDVATSAKLYSIIPLKDGNYLTIDSVGHYDGTEGARKLLYYVCGNEVIDLEQLKELCWEPDLVSKIMGVNKEPITAKKLSELNICNYTPLADEKGYNNGQYHFEITSRTGGVGEILLFVNGKQIKSYPPQQLPKKENIYTLTVNGKDIADYFLSTEENKVEVKALTTDKQMLSRSAIISVPPITKTSQAINVYAISVGISQYKSDKLKLTYASKDAVDFSKVLADASRKLFNIDGKDHVFTYTFDTDQGSDHWPTKDNIRNSFEEVAQLAKADDIMIIFFAGHGILNNINKQFYYLTQEASSFELSGVEKEVAISSEELSEWMRNIRAQKQLLILDACNSGQVMADLLQKREIPADQQRALERLKDRTGTYILTASASTQPAYETSLYGQGLLTYGLLSGIKLGGGLRDNKFIDVNRWFNYAADEVKALIKDIGGRQDPQIIGNASFDVGMVDKAVADEIQLSIKKKIFRRSNLIKEGIIPTDDLNLSASVDEQLIEISTEKRSSLVFMEDNTYNDAYSITGKYIIKNDSIVVKVYLIRGQTKPVYQFQIAGSILKKEEFSLKIANRIKEFIGKEQKQ